MAKTKEYFSKRDLLRRGWTDAMINNLLGQPDSTRSTGHFLGSQAFIWESRRVRKVEASVEFASLLAKSLKRRKLCDAIIKRFEQNRQSGPLSDLEYKLQGIDVLVEMYKNRGSRTLDETPDED